MLNFGSDSQFHHYLQVNGSPISEQNDFSAGDHTGVLRHRPSRYVPVKVPLYDEQGTVNDRIAVTQSDDPDLRARDVTSRFNWVYRPEFSFSVIDLELSAINLQGTQDGSQNNNGDAQKINIIDDTTPVISSADDLVEVIFNLIGSEYERITPFEGERQYIFALGEQEIEVRIDKGKGQEQQITFKNLEHLAQLNAEDYLTLSLYLNQDAQNVLWEWGFEYLIMTSRDADNDLETDDTYYVSADDPVAPMIAILAGYSERDPELKQSMQLKWTTDNGSLSVGREINDTNGIFKTELTMPVQAGSRAELTAELEGSDNPIRFKPIEVIPGAPAKLIVRKVNGPAVLGVLGSASQEYEITVTDAHGNIVADGTSVGYALEGYAKTTSQETATTAGTARVTVTGSERFDDAIKLTITSGSAVEVIDLTSAELTVNIDLPAEMRIGTAQQADITVVNPAGSAEGMEVVISAPYLGVKEQAVVLDADGRAVVTLMAPPVPAETYVHARVGYAGSQRKTVSIIAPDAIIHADNYRPLLGESTQAGSYGYERFDGAQIDLGYEVEKNLQLQGVAGEVITAQLGDAYYPNQMPRFALALDASSVQAFSTDAAKDDTGTYSLTATGVTLDGASLYGVGSSTRFDGSATISASTSELSGRQRPNWAMAIKPEQAGTLLNLGGGQSLSIAGGELIYRITTTDGTYQVRAPVQMNHWQKIAARVTDTQLELYVNDLRTPVTSAYSGSLLAGSGDLTIGTGYTGLMQELRFYDGQSQPLLALNNGGSTASIQANSSGIATVTVNSLGNLNATGQTLGLTYVHLVYNGQRTHIPVISEEAFKQVGAVAANIALIGPPLALNNFPDYSDYDPWGGSSLPFSSLMPQAQAFGWLDAVDLFIPVSSVINVVEQIGKIGTEEFDPIVLAVAVLDVAITFSGPLAAPLKVAFKPLAKLLTNPATKKLVKILGPFIGKVAKRVVDSRSIDPLINLLPLLMIIGEIAADEEARKAIPVIIDAINSSEDLQVWFDYFNLPEDGWEGDEQPPLELDLAGVDNGVLPLSGVVSQAYAAVKLNKRISGQVAAKKIRLVMKNLAKGNIDLETAAKSITRSMAIIIKEGTGNSAIRKVLTDPKTLTAGMTLVLHAGVRHFQNLLRGKDDKGRAVTSRTPVFLQLAAIAYLESNINCEEAGCWTSDKNERLIEQIRILYAKALGTPLLVGYDNPRVAGYQFQLTMAAFLHAMDQVGMDIYGKLVDIESPQRVFLQQYDASGKAVIEVDPRDRSLKGDFSRKIDFLMDMGAGNKPTFIEVKSYKGRQGTSLTPITDTLKSRFGV